MDLKNDMNFNKEIEDFNDCLELINYRPSTIENYLKTIHECMVWINKTYGITLAEADISQLRKFLLYLKKERRLSARTINVYNCSIKKYSAHMLRKPITDMDLPTMKVDKRLPSVPCKADTFRIISGINNLKYKTIIALTFACALRIGEAVSLHYGDVYMRDGRIRIRASVSKNRSEGYVELPEKMKTLLREYANAYGKGCSSEDYMFPGRKEGDHISKGSVAAVFKKRMEELGWQDRGYSLHSMRHAHGLFYYQAGADLFQVKERLRHKSILSTMIYVQLDGELKERKSVENPFDDPRFSI